MLIKAVEETVGGRGQGQGQLICRRDKEMDKEMDMERLEMAPNRLAV
jgi:hypothetical protein